MLHTFPFAVAFLCAFAAAAAPARAAPVEDVPYVTTPDNVTAAMLDLAGVAAGDHVIDLGSGDGRIVIAAARRGATGLGVEIDPRLVAESVANARRAGVADRARFLEQDLFATDLAPATVVTMYLLPEVNLRLRPAILGLRPGTRVVSHDWDMGDWNPDRSVTVAVPEKKLGLEKSSRVFLWIVPARVAGLWCGRAGLRRATLRLGQAFQVVRGELREGGSAPESVAGRLDGAALAMAGGGRLAFAGAGARATGRLAAYDWRRADGGACPTP
ncbi:MAG: 50S ribosomal protein L11 methyltransferase [Burkholderiales bacterium]|nr:50S ribosomal protein L11 methyltransferase [Burkholderiales bacterium]